MSEHMCCEKVATADMAFYRPKPCGNKAKVEVDGLHYCGMHDPSRVAAKRAERTAKWEEERAKQLREWALSSAAPELLEALKRVDKTFKPLWPEEVEAIAFVRAAIAKAEGHI